MNKLKRRFFIPEVIQSSIMDCGPAALKAVIEGFGGQASYGRLREACHTDVDGTSIDTIEVLAQQLGLEASQLLVPHQHLLLPKAQALPAIAVVTEPNGMTHFIVVWSMIGDWVQIMDSGTGRHWIRTQTLQKRLYRHQQAVDKQAWFEWASSADFLPILEFRLLTICPDESWAQACIEQAIKTNDWQGIANVDAAVTMTCAMIESGGVSKGEDAGVLVNHLIGHPQLISPEHFIATKISTQNPQDSQKIVFSGAVILHCRGYQPPKIDDSSQASTKAKPQSAKETNIDIKLETKLGTKLTAKEPQPEQHILAALKADGLFQPTLILMGALVASFGLAIEVIVLRGMVEISQQLTFTSQRMDVYAWVLMFFIALLILEWPLAKLSRSLGRKLEVRLRQSFLQKLPKLEDRYFHSRLTSDMMQRAFELRQLRNLPVMGFNVIRTVLQMLFITLGLVILFPQGAMLVIVTSIIILACSFLTQPLMAEQDMRFRTHISGLSRFYLDALMGLTAISSHKAGHAVTVEHDRLLVDWVKSGRRFFASFEYVTLANFIVSTLLTIWLVFSYLTQGGDTTGLLVLLYWMLYLPQLGAVLAENVQQYPSLRNRVIRMLEPLSAPDESSDWYDEPVDGKPVDSKTVDSTDLSPDNANQKSGVKIELNQVNVDLAGQRVLHHWQTKIEAAEHIAIVGQSGSGKSSLMGLLLGWHRPVKGGEVLVDGQLYHGQRIAQLRRELVWVDPQVQIWDKSLQHNLNYGQAEDKPIAPTVLEQAQLLDILANLPAGQDSLLGENGSLLSGGEAQRVRLARGLNKQAPRLVILDEPFRGLSQDARQSLLAKVRVLFKDITLLFISHHVTDTKGFNRVWVVDKGALVEDAAPSALLANTDSRFSQLIAQEKQAQALLLDNPKWRKMSLENGQLDENEH